MLNVVAGAAALGLAVATLSQPVAAQVARIDPDLQNGGAPLVTKVQIDANRLIPRGGRPFQGRTGLQGGGGGFRGNGGGPRFDGGGRGERFGGGDGYRRRGNGFGIGAGVVGGLAAGALVGGAIASQGAPGYGYGYGYDGAYDPGYGYAPPPPPPVEEETVDASPAVDSDSYCSQRYQSYDPSSGTYLGYDGLRHPCP